MRRFPRKFGATDTESLKKRLASVQQSMSGLHSQLVTLHSQLVALKNEEGWIQRQLKNEADSIQSELNYDFNLRAPIFRLPVETLCQIFEYCTTESTRDIADLLLVCRDWYEIAIGCPALWTNLKLDGTYYEQENLLAEEQQFVDACYTRSRSLRLHVTFDLSHFDPLGSDEVGDDEDWAWRYADGLRIAWSLLKYLLSRDISRWKTFHFAWPFDTLSDPQALSVDIEPDVLNCVTRLGVNLERVVIENPGLFLNCNVQTQPAGSRLTTLTLLGSHWDWGSPDPVGGLFPYVTYLSVGWIGDTHWDHVIASSGLWLQVFPRLQELVLLTTGRNLQSEEPNNPDYIDLYSRSLPSSSVKTLRLIGHLPHRLLATLRLPALETLHIKYKADCTSSSDGATTLPFAKNVKTLIMEGPRSFQPEKWDMNQVVKLAFSLGHLTSLVVDETLWARLRPLEVQVGHMPLTLNGKNVYSLDAAALTKEIRRRLKMHSSPTVGQ